MTAPTNSDPASSERLLPLVLVAVGAAALLLLATNALARLQGSGPITVIDHVIVLMQENHSFDNYFGQLPKDGQPDALGLPGGASNPNPLYPAASPISAFHQQLYCEVADLGHTWDQSHQAWDDGKMDRFTAASTVTADPTGTRAMGYYDETDLPYYYALANTFAIGDRYFASTLSGSVPNRLYLYAATSFGHVQNDTPPPTGWTQPTIFDRLDAAHITWKVYYSQRAFATDFSYVRNHAHGNVVPIRDYFTDAAAGTLPQVSFIDPIWDGPMLLQNSEHPPADIQVGQTFVASVIGALVVSPNWSSSALFLTYDESGGYYDHVAPPGAPVPDDIAPLLEGSQVTGAFDRYGFRVPMVVVSPYAKPHFVSHVVNDHTSILSFLEHRFDLPALTRRDALANPMLEFFDFNHAAFATAPALPAPTVDAAQLSACASRYAGRSP
jgi:phospholipase C